MGLQHRRPQITLLSTGPEPQGVPRVPRACKRACWHGISIPDPLCPQAWENALYSLKVLLSRGQPGDLGAEVLGLHNVAEHWTTGLVTTVRTPLLQSQGPHWEEVPESLLWAG